MNDENRKSKLKSDQSLNMKIELTNNSKSRNIDNVSELVDVDKFKEIELFNQKINS